MFAFFSFLTSLAGVVMYQTYAMVTEVVENKNLSQAYKVLIFVIVIIIILFVFDIVSIFIRQKILFNISFDIKCEIMNKVFSINFNEFRKSQKSYYFSMLINDAENVESSYYNNWFNLLDAISNLTIMFIAIGLVGIKYIAVVILLSIPSIFQPFLLKKKMEKAALDTSAEMSKYSAVTNEYIYGMETIKTSNKTKVFTDKFFNNTDTLEKIRYKENSVVFLNRTIIIFAVYFLKLGSLLFFVNSSISGAISLATATVLFGYANNVGNPIASILTTVSAINSTKQVRNKMSDFIKTHIQEDKRENLVSFENNIKFENVKFSYGEAAILNGIDFTFEKNKKYILFGKSGSGKSTLFKLLMGYENDYTGKILIDNKDIKSLNSKSLWENISYMQQNVFIMNGTLKENITLFNEKISDKKVMEAVRLSGLSELVESLKEGIYEQLTEGGTNFSGGEKQRISLARAIASDKEILLIDEGFSALDNIKSYEIEKMLLRLDKTIISITHKISSCVRDYDMILLLEIGKIAESGSYSRLMEECSNFSTFFVEKESEGEPFEN